MQQADPHAPLWSLAVRQAYGIYFHAASKGSLVTLSSLTFLTPVRSEFSRTPSFSHFSRADSIRHSTHR